MINLLANLLALGHQDVHRAACEAGGDGQHHSHRELVVGLLRVQVQDVSLEEEGRLADQDNSGQEEDNGDDLDGVEFVIEHQGGEDDGDEGTGEDDAQGVRNIHEGDAGEATYERYRAA